MDGIKAVLNNLIGLTYIVVASVMVAVCLLRPQHNLIPLQLFIGIAFAIVFFTVLYRVLSLCLQKSGSVFSDRLFVLLAVLWGVVLICAGVFCRNSTVSFLDYEICYRAATEFAQNMPLSEAAYFSVNPHNWKCVLVLAFAMKAGYAIGLDDPYYLLLILNVILIESTLFSCRYLLKTFFDDTRTSFMLIVMFGSCLPLYALSQSFYTDSLSFGYSVIGISLLHYAFVRLDKKPVKAACLMLSGILMCFGYTMKVTSFICVIAFLICFMLKSDNVKLCKKHIYSFALVALGFVFIWTLLEKASMNYEWYRVKDKYSEPTISYIALGMKADGTYYGNREFRIALDEITDSAEKAEFTKTYILENISEFWNADHIIAKMRANYASGNLGAEDFAKYPYSGDNVLSRLFNYDRDLYWYGCKYDMIWLFQIYFVTIIGAALSLFKKIKTADLLMRAYELTFLGYFVFLFFWEANNRQLFNMIPMLIIGYVISLEYIYKLWKRSDVSAK